MFKNSIIRLFTPVIKYIYKQLMARKEFRTTAKSKIKFSATKYNGESFFQVLHIVYLLILFLFLHNLFIQFIL